MEFEYECEFCHNVFSGNNELDKHVMDIHESVENIENFLVKEKKSKQIAENIYVNKEEEDKKYKCNVCNANSFDVFHEYQNHLKSHFTNFHGNKQQQKSTKKVFKKDGKTRLNFHPTKDRQIQKTFPKTTATTTTAKNENCRKLKEGVKNDSIQWAKNLKKVQFREASKAKIIIFYYFFLTEGPRKRGI